MSESSLCHFRPLLLLLLAPFICISIFAEMPVLSEPALAPNAKEIAFVSGGDRTKGTAIPRITLKNRTQMQMRTARISPFMYQSLRPSLPTSTSFCTHLCLPVERPAYDSATKIDPPAISVKAEMTLGRQ